MIFQCELFALTLYQSGVDFSNLMAWPQIQSLYSAPAVGIPSDRHTPSRPGRCRGTHLYRLHPWCTTHANHLTPADQTAGVTFPDTDPSQLAADAPFSMAAGDFLEVLPRRRLPHGPPVTGHGPPGKGRGMRDTGRGIRCDVWVRR